MPDAYERVFQFVGPALVLIITAIAVRMLAYWWSFIFHWKRYRRRESVSAAALMALPDVPFIKIQITTRGSVGSTEVILRGIRNVMALAAEDPIFFGSFVSIEVVTESEVQARVLENTFAGASIPVEGLVMPPDYETPLGTKLKARGLHYAVERRREGWNWKRPGRTFIVHYDEESVMTPSELRKLIACLATTDKKLLEGPIYYPLEYMAAAPVCRAMEANRPVGCFECRHVMEKGVPLHLHGSNLVVEEQFELDLGWDIGNLDGQPFIAEDYVFGVNAFLAGGPEVFGWHGCVMLEQPPFSFKSAFKQRHRWVFGVLQGVLMARRAPSFERLPRRLRFSLIWGTRFRVSTFALGAISGSLSLLFLPVVLFSMATALTSPHPMPVSPSITAMMSLVGVLWLGTVFIGAWCNVLDAGLTPAVRRAEIARAVALAPVAGVLETAAGLWAVTQWLVGRREVSWNPTPKTKAADAAADWRQSA